MRGTGEEGTTRTILEPEVPPRPRGGSPMLRLLDLLERQAYTSQAEEVATHAVADDEQQAAVALARSLDLLPERRPRRSSKTAAATGGGSAAAPAEVSSRYAEVA